MKRTWHYVAAVMERARALEQQTNARVPLRFVTSLLHQT